jgi:hypothetical protein
LGGIVGRVRLSRAFHSWKASGGRKDGAVYNLPQALFI